MAQQMHPTYGPDFAAETEKDLINASVATFAFRTATLRDRCRLLFDRDILALVPRSPISAQGHTPITDASRGRAATMAYKGMLELKGSTKYVQYEHKKIEGMAAYIYIYIYHMISDWGLTPV